MADIFNGKWKLTASEKFDEYMKAVGVGLVMRKLANAATPVQDITIDGDNLRIVTTTTFKTTDLKCRIGEVFDEETADGRKVKTTITLNGNKLLQEQKGTDSGKDSVILREVDGGKMKMTLSVEDVECIRQYEKQ